LAGRIRNSKNVKVSGSVKIQGVPTDTSKKKIRQLFAYVAQRDSLHSASTVKESLLFSAKLRLPKREHFYDKLVTKLMEELGLTQCGDSLISELSGGERRRTSIGVELISNPSIIFLDEPTSGCT
jgi:ABC-type multidrug transport system ATPase subunit